MQQARARWLTVVLSGLLALACGCATVKPLAEVADVGDSAHSSSSFSYAAGRGVQTYASPPSAVLAALDDALVDLHCRKTRNIQNGAVFRVEARTADRSQVIATIRSLQGQTQIGVRAGWFGDEALSRALLQRVAIRLGSAAPEAIPTEAPSAPAANPFFSRKAVSDEEMFRDMAEAPYRDRVIP